MIFFAQADIAFPSTWTAVGIQVVLMLAYYWYQRGKNQNTKDEVLTSAQVIVNDSFKKLQADYEKIKTQLESTSTQRVEDQRLISELRTSHANLKEQVKLLEERQQDGLRERTELKAENQTLKEKSDKQEVTIDEQTIAIKQLEVSLKSITQMYHDERELRETKEGTNKHLEARLAVMVERNSLLETRLGKSQKVIRRLVEDCSRLGGDTSYVLEEIAFDVYADGVERRAVERGGDRSTGSTDGSTDGGN